jgi:hypothetical protein
MRTTDLHRLALNSVLLSCDSLMLPFPPSAAISVCFNRGGTSHPGVGIAIPWRQTQGHDDPMTPDFGKVLRICTCIVRWQRHLAYSTILLSSNVYFKISLIKPHFILISAREGNQRRQCVIRHHNMSMRSLPLKTTAPFW